MARISFGDNGYEYFDADGRILFTANEAHNDLFDYVSKDLSPLSNLLEEYVSKKMDTTTFELTDYQYNDDDTSKIEEVLTSAHPYYKHEYREVMKKVIGDYFNTCLIYSCYKERSFDSNIIDERWYMKRFEALAPTFLLVGDENPNAPYKKYKKLEGNYYDPNDIFEALIPNVSPPKGFSQELITQKNVKRMLYWILDNSAPIIGEMTMPQRIWLLGGILMRERFPKGGDCLSRKVGN